MSTIPMGTVIAGRYVIESILGQGGMGIVARAQDPKLARAVAVKLLPAAFVGNEVARERLLREARAAAALSHHGIVHMYDVGESEDGGAFIVMELIDGTSLEARARDRSLTVAECLHIIVEVAKTLAFAHRAGFVHRDIKPANIVLRADDGSPVVLDFGLARKFLSQPLDTLGPSALRTPSRDLALAHAVRLTAQDAIVGTPAYLSPEQARNDTLDGRSDQFSLAITAFELLTGHLPWAAESAAEMIAAIMLDPPRSLRELAPELPATLDLVLQQALAKTPADRYADCDAFASAIQQALADVLSADGQDSRGTEPIELAKTQVASRSDVSASVKTKIASAELAATHAAAPMGSTAERASSNQHDNEHQLTSALHEAEPAPVQQHKTLAPTVPAVRHRRWPLVALALAAIGSVSWLAARKTSRPPHNATASAAPPTVMAAGAVNRSTVVACPVFVSEQPWLGGALATLSCERLAVWLGGSYSHSKIPAELLQLPTRPVDDERTADPYGAQQSRSRTLAAAQAFDRVLDGAVTVTDGQVHVRLSLKSADLRQTIASSEGRAAVPARAVGQAVAALVAQGVIERVGEPDPEFARWYHVHTIPDLLALDTIERWGDQRSERAECAGFAQRPEAFGPRWPIVERTCRGIEPTARPPESHSNELFVATVDAALLPATIDAASLARDAQQRRQREPSVLGQSMLATVEAWMWLRAGDAVRAREAAFLAAEIAPKYTPAWRIAMIAARALPQPRATLRAILAWAPTVSYAWSDLANLEEGSFDPTMRLNFMRRACTLSPGNASNETDLAIALMAAGQKEELRSVASRLGTVGPSERIAADWLMIGVDGAEARFSAAVTRALTTLESVEQFGVLDQQDVTLLYFGAEAAVIAGRERQLGQRFAERVVLAEPTRLARNESWTLRTSVGLCLLAPRPVAVRCIERVGALVRAGHFRFGVPANGDALLSGAMLAARGDMRGASDAWRPLVASVTQVDAPMALLLAPAFDAAHEYDIAARIDAPLLSSRGWNGAGMVHVRAALRAQAQGRHDEALRYAQQVINAWATADCAITHITKLRAAIAGL
jgi:serine/threonine protein kinase